MNRGSFDCLKSERDIYDGNIISIGKNAAFMLTTGLNSFLSPSFCKESLCGQFFYGAVSLSFVYVNAIANDLVLPAPPIMAPVNI